MPLYGQRRARVRHEMCYQRSSLRRRQLRIARVPEQPQALVHVAFLRKWKIRSDGQQIPELVVHIMVLLFLCSVQPSI